MLVIHPFFSILHHWTTRVKFCFDGHWTAAMRTCFQDSFMKLFYNYIILLLIKKERWKNMLKISSISSIVRWHNSWKMNVSSLSYQLSLPIQGVQWGSISLLDAEKRLLANALLDFSNERFILLSESCIPIFNFPTVYQYLTSSNHSFVESFDEPTPRGRGRYRRQMAPQIKLYHWRKGSEWFELNRELALNIVADLKYYSIFMKHCRPSCYPDEHYIPTYINMFHGALNSNRTITWVDWSRGGPHPAMFGRGDITVNFIQSIRNNGTICKHNFVPTSVCFLFARKFAPSTLEALLNISSTVLKFWNLWIFLTFATFRGYSPHSLSVTGFGLILALSIYWLVKCCWTCFKCAWNDMKLKKQWSETIRWPIPFIHFSFIIPGDWWFTGW